jgi:hypothetical protein
MAKIEGERGEMTKREALECMTGYQFLGDEEKRREAMTHIINNTPNWDKESGLTFEEALRAMKEGKKVRRRSWRDKNGVLIGDGCFVWHSGGYATFTITDMYATDWEIVE